MNKHYYVTRSSQKVGGRPAFESWVELGEKFAVIHDITDLAVIRKAEILNFLELIEHGDEAHQAWLRYEFNLWIESIFKDPTNDRRTHPSHREQLHKHPG